MALPPLSRAQVQRYSRQLLLPWMSQTGQQALLATRVGVPLTADPACEWAVAYLATAGVGHLVLHSQHVPVTGPLLAASERLALFGEADGALRYARLLARAVRDRNPEVLVSLAPTRPDAARPTSHAAGDHDHRTPLFFECMTAAPGDAASAQGHLGEDRECDVPPHAASPTFDAGAPAPPHLGSMWHAAVACCQWIARRGTTPEPAPASQPPLLTGHQLQAMLAAATAAFPHEACGWLAGANVVCATNVAPQPEVSYAFSDADQLQFANALCSTAPPFAIFHSHPRGQAALSATDMAFAVAPHTRSAVDAAVPAPMYPVVQIVLAGAPGQWVVRAFAWSMDGNGMPGYCCYDEVWCTL